MGYSPWHAAACLLVVVALAAVDSKKPNIIMFVADDVGTADHQLYDPAMRTPNLLRLAKLGITMNQSYTLQACTPTRTALLTGKYPFKIGMHIGKIKGTNLRWTPLGHTFLSETLQENKYQTFAIGKWHLGYCHWDLTPMRRGFDYFYGFYSGAQSYFNHSKSDGSSYDFRDGERSAVENNNTYATELHTAKVLELIKNQDQNKKPFFIYMAYQNAHAPFEAEPRYVSEYCSHVKNGTRQTHCAMVAAMDESIGKIMDTLVSKGLDQNTILIYLSDNGGPLGYGSYNWPLRGGKASFWEGGMRSHTIFVWPKKMASKLVGTTNSNLFHVTDWYPTLVRIAGGKKALVKLQAENDLDGINQFLNIVKGRKQLRDRMIYSIDETKNRTALRIGNMKLMTGYPASSADNCGWWAPPDMEEAGTAVTTEVKKNPANIPYYKLYDVVNDKEERHNLFDDDRYATIRQELLDWLAEEQPKLVPFPKDLKKNRYGNSKFYSGMVSPGWCCPNCPA